MRRVLLFVLSFLILLSAAAPVGAQIRPRTPSPTPVLEATPLASASAETASPSAEIAAKIEQKEEKDITQTTPQVKSRLARILDDNPIGPLSWNNFIQQAIRRAVDGGVPANILVLLLLFPVIASFIAVSRHFIGLEGFGVYIPAVLAVALLSTGIISGLSLFIVIILVATIGRDVVKRLRLQYLPRTAVVLWAVSIAVFGVLLISPFLIRVGIDLITLSIFPILVLILLSENFIDAQLSSTQSRALQLMAETIVLAVMSALFVRTQFVQDFVILHPEITILAVLLIDLAVGKYTGLRVTEYLRFKSIIDREE
jgi:hypothetical protein